MRRHSSWPGGFCRGARGSLLRPPPNRTARGPSILHPHARRQDLRNGAVGDRGLSRHLLRLARSEVELERVDDRVCKLHLLPGEGRSAVTPAPAPSGDRSSRSYQGLFAPKLPPRPELLNGFPNLALFLVGQRECPCTAAGPQLALPQDEAQCFLDRDRPTEAAP